MTRPGLLTAKGKFAALTALLAIAAAIYMVAGAATSTARLTLNGTISPKCEFTTVPGPANFQLANGERTIGDLGYTCNLPEGSNASFILQISNGGLKNEATGDVVPYDVQWNVLPNDGTIWQNAANFLSGQGFGWPVSAPGVERKGAFRIRITIRGYVPLVCNASIVSTDVTEGASLRIDAMVNQSCNAKHQMSVRFTTEADTGNLNVVYNGSSPTVSAPGLRSFGQERFARAVRALRITYSGGTPAQRQALAQTVTIEVTPL